MNFQNPCAATLRQRDYRLYWTCECGSQSRITWSPLRESEAEAAAASHVRRGRKMARAAA